MNVQVVGQAMTVVNHYAHHNVFMEHATTLISVDVTKAGKVMTVTHQYVHKVV